MTKSERAQFSEFTYHLMTNVVSLAQYLDNEEIFLAYKSYDILCKQSLSELTADVVL